VNSEGLEVMGRLGSDMRSSSCRQLRLSRLPPGSSPPLVTDRSVGRVLSPPSSSVGCTVLLRRRLRDASVRRIHFDRHSKATRKTIVLGGLNVRAFTNKVDDFLEVRRDQLLHGLCFSPRNAASRCGLRVCPLVAR
jgi:hypothetical protein